MGVLGNQDNAFTQFRAYPNPTQEKINISLGSIHSEISITITNMLGHVIQQENLRNTEKINLAIEGNSGVYFATVKTNKRTEDTLKIVKQ